MTKMIDKPMEKSRFILALTILTTMAISCTNKVGAPTQPINVMTFNVRYDNPYDSLNNWKYRKDRVANAILFYDADIAGTQEVLHNQLQDLQQRLTGYEVLGVGREDGKEQGEYSALWYKRDRFDLKDSGYFWISETPEVPGVKGWDAACERIATWAKLEDKLTGRHLFVLNTHLDHEGIQARREGVTLLLNKIEELSEGLPVIVTGDFNSDPNSEVITHMTSGTLKDTRKASPIVYGPDWSFHNFGRVPMDERTRIDYIFINEGLKATRYGVLAEQDNNEFLSDHAPVLVTLLPQD